MDSDSGAGLRRRPVALARGVARWALRAVLAGLALIGFLSVTRGTPVGRVRVLDGDGRLPSVRDPEFARAVHAYTGLHLTAGTRVEVLTNGDGTYPRLWADLRSARRTLSAQLYFSQPGAVADTFASILVERARAGVRVLLLLDAFGSQNLTDAWRQRLRDAGVEVAALRPLRWYALDRISSRSHVRAIVVDGRVAYTGGFGLADYWLGSGYRPDEWRDTNVRFEGSEVLQLQGAFASAWAEATGELISGDQFFPTRSMSEAGSGPSAGVVSSAPRAALAGVLFTQPTSGSTPAERFLALTIASARRKLFVSNSYFVPDDDFRRLLGLAAARGVDVRVLTVGPRTDVKSTWYAGRHRYEELLRAGVRIFEYRPTVMHAKTIVADGGWSVIGSMNFDNRSLAFNDEASLVVLDSVIGASMDSLFMEDLRYAREIKIEEWQRRSQGDRLLEWGSSLLARVL